MMEVLVFSGNIYIESTALKHSNKSIRRWTIVRRKIKPLGGKLDAVKNYKETRGKLLNVRVDITR